MKNHNQTIQEIKDEYPDYGNYNLDEMVFPINLLCGAVIFLMIALFIFDNM